MADQGGVSFWVPGLFGSLAAVPQQPGFNFASIYYHTSVDASGELAASRQIEIGRVRSANLKVNVNVDLKARADLGFFVPGYVFDTKIFGGQFAVSMMVPVRKADHHAGRYAERFARAAQRHAARLDHGIRPPVLPICFRRHRCAGTQAFTIS